MDINKGTLGVVAALIVWASPQRKKARVAVRGAGAELRVSF